MAQFIVMTVKNNDVPALGELATARIYRGDHADEAAAVAAAAGVLTLDTGQRLWAVSAASLTRYVTTTTISRSVAAG